MNIEVIVSTMNDGILNLKINKDLNYLIIHQVTNLSNLEKYDELAESFNSRGVRYIRSYESGLSKSRNLGIENSIGEYLWIMDDDVTIFDSAMDDIKKCIDSHSADLFVLNYISDESQKNIKITESYLNILSVASVSSISMLIKKSSIGGDIRFDEGFGLGTKYPSGEEYIFCCDFLKSGKKIFKTNIITCSHPPVTSGQDFYSTPNKLAAKKYMFRRTHGVVVGYILYIGFLIKKFPILFKSKSLLNTLRSFFI